MQHTHTNHGNKISGNSNQQNKTTQEHTSDKQTSHSIKQTKTTTRQQNNNTTIQIQNIIKNKQDMKHTTKRQTQTNR